MRKGKKIIVSIIIMLIILLIGGGVFAYVYVTTDIFKSDRQLFAQYFTQIVSEDGFIDKRINDFSEKKQQIPYENSGEITVHVEYPDEEIDTTIMEKVNDLTVRFSGETDRVNQKVQQAIEIDYGNNVIFPFTYKQDGDKFGLKFDKLSKQFISIRNENLDKLAEKLDSDEGIVSIPQRINSLLELKNDKLIFSEEEQNQLIKIYGKVFLNELKDEMFSTQKTENNESHILELNGESIKNIIIKLLEETKQSPLIINKINGLMLESDPEAEKIDISVIDELIQNLNEDDFSEIPIIKIALVQSNKLVQQIIIESGESQLTISKNNIENNVNYEIKSIIKESATEDIVQSTSILGEDTSSERGESEVYFNIQYTGLDTENVQSNCEIGFGITTESERMSYNYKIDTNTDFKGSVVIESLDEEIAIFLNDHESEQVTNFISQVGEKLTQINKMQMEQLGLKEDENPLMYSNPVTILVVGFKNDMDDVIENVSAQEIQIFNNSLIMYEGEGVTGAYVNMMIQTVSNLNLSTELEGQSDNFVKLTLDGNPISDSENIETSKMYVVEAIYNDEGRVSEMKITTKN